MSVSPNLPAFINSYTYRGKQKPTVGRGRSVFAFPEQIRVVVSWDGAHGGDGHGLVQGQIR